MNGLIEVHIIRSSREANDKFQLESFARKAHRIYVQVHGAEVIRIAFECLIAEVHASIYPQCQ